jgi:hypothetical protein
MFYSISLGTASRVALSLSESIDNKTNTLPKPLTTTTNLPSRPSQTTNMASQQQK